MSKPRFQIGDWVMVSQSTVTKTSDGKRGFSTKPCDPPFVGQVVGACLRQSGIVEEDHGSWGEDGEPSDGFRWLESDQSVLMWQVRRGLRGRIVEARDEDVEPTDAQGPVRWMGASMTAELRTIYSEQSVYWERDSRGRLVSSWNCGLIRDIRAGYTNAATWPERHYRGREEFAATILQDVQEKGYVVVEGGVLRLTELGASVRSFADKRKDEEDS